MSDETPVGPPWPEEALDRHRWGSFVAAAETQLVRARERDRLPQSLLVAGPPGLGREVVAMTAVTMLTCPDGRGGECACGSCRRVRAGLHPDVVFVQPTGAGHTIGIDQIRKGIVLVAAGRPYEAPRRVWVLDGVDVGIMGREAANTFLKTLEEPPAHVSFVLLAASAAAVLATIRSRCQILRLPGAVAVAEGLGQTLSPELGPVAEGSVTATLVDDVHRALGQALDRCPDGLLALGSRLAAHPSGYEVAASAVLAAAGAEHDGHRAERLVVLADRLLRRARRATALNLNPERQLQSCLLEWYREQ